MSFATCSNASTKSCVSLFDYGSSTTFGTLGAPILFLVPHNIDTRHSPDISAPIVANVIPEAALRSRRLCRSSIASSLHHDRVRVHAAFAWYDRRTRRRAANFSIARTTYARLSRLESSIDPRLKHRGDEIPWWSRCDGFLQFLAEQRKIRNLSFRSELILIELWRKREYKRSMSRYLQRVTLHEAT